MNPQQNQPSAPLDPAAVPPRPDETTEPTQVVTPVTPWQPEQSATPDTNSVTPQPEVTPGQDSPTIIPPAGEQSAPAFPEAVKPLQEPLLVSEQPVQPAPMPTPESMPPMNPMESPQSGMPAGPAMQPQSMPPASSDMQPAGPSQAKKLLMVLFILVVVIGVGVGAYMLLNKKSTPSSNAINNSAKASQTNVPDLNTVKNFTLVTPTNLQGLKVDSSNSATDFTSLTNSDGTCTLAFGKRSQADLPGTDIGSVVAKEIAGLKAIDSNIETSSPMVASPRILKGSNGKSYSMPTTSFTFSDAQAKGVADTIYSVSQLSDGSHAVVIISCDATNSTTAAVTKAADALNSVANSIQVKIN